MKHYLSLSIVVVCLVSGCEKSQFDDDITNAYGLPDKSSEYKKLVASDPAKLSDDELYHRVLTLWNTPYRELKLPTSTGTAHIIVSGPADGEAIILLHGMKAHATMWYPNVKALSKKYRVYAIDDIQGPGKSITNLNDVSIEVIKEWYFEIFNALNLEKVILVGASQGGWIATHIALANPEKIQKLILLSPAQTFIWLEPSMDIVSNLLFSLNPQREGLRDNLATLSSNVDGINQLYIDQFFRTIQTAPSSPLLMDMQPFEGEQLSSLKVPTLLLVGDDDLFNNQKSLDRAEKNMPCAHAEIIPNSGHFITVDQADQVNKKILGFIAGKTHQRMKECFTALENR